MERLGFIPVSPIGAPEFTICTPRWQKGLVASSNKEKTSMPAFKCQFLYTKALPFFSIQSTRVYVTGII